MRVIAGAAKGRRLHTPQGLATRPLMDRVREALFSSLGERVEGARVLDLYAGSGSLGIEALSRGAASATFVENNRKAVDSIRANLGECGFEGVVEAGDVERFVTRSPQGFDLAFVDPPYSLNEKTVTAVMTGVAKLLTQGGVAVLHRRAGGLRPKLPESLSLIDRRRYGDAELFRAVKEGVA